MRITFVDDSVPFDGYSPTSQPLGGPEKAFASLPAALAMRGHDVQVFNRCAFPVTAGGAAWHPFEDQRPDDTDVLVAFRHPRLLDFVATAKRRVLWTAGPPEELNQTAEQALLVRHQPTVIFMSEAQRERWTNALSLAVKVIEPGIAASYLEEDPATPAEPPRAVTTSHPLAHLGWVLKLWTEQIRPAVPEAQLHVYSALLNKGELGAEVPPAVRPVLDLALAGRDHGITVLRPQPDPQMAEAYRAARVHLYPGQVGELLAWTLAESQAAGLPAVTMASSPLMPVRVADGQTGKIAPAEANFVAAAIDLLGDRAAFERMSANARLLRRGRTWAVAAAEFEEAFA
jgi:glycosyltransferase involved in cell wall biosynthesis